MIRRRQLRLRPEEQPSTSSDEELRAIASHSLEHNQKLFEELASLRERVSRLEGAQQMARAWGAVAVAAVAAIAGAVLGVLLSARLPLLGG
jgi:hypothetical protein